jgi:hypothetical protein
MMDLCKSMRRNQCFTTTSDSFGVVHKWRVVHIATNERRIAILPDPGDKYFEEGECNQQTACTGERKATSESSHHNKLALH